MLLVQRLTWKRRGNLPDRAGFHLKLDSEYVRKVSGIWRHEANEGREVPEIEVSKDEVGIVLKTK